MIKKILVILLLTGLAAFGLYSCFSNMGGNDKHNSKNSLDWEGVYIGT